MREPLVPLEVDTEKLDGFMLDTVKLLGSELVALSTGDEFKAAVLLWCRAWKQRPAASLPNDDRILSSFAGLPAARWRKVKDMAMRGWVLCSDGRWYHPVLAADAVRAHKAAEQRRAAIRKRYEKDNEKPTGVPTGRATAVASPVLPETGRDGTGRSLDSVANATGAAAPPLKDLVWNAGLEWLAKKTGKSADKHRSLVGQWMRDHGDAKVYEAFQQAFRNSPVEPVAYIEKVLAAQPKTSRGNDLSAALDAVFAKEAAVGE